MTDLISRQAVLDALSNLNAISFYEAQEDSKETYYEIRNAIKALPSVNPQPKTGYWIMRPNGFKCSRCLIVHRWHSIFCPSCGAKMVESPPEREVNDGRV